MTTQQQTPASATTVRMMKDQTLIDRTLVRTQAAFAQAGAVLDEALGWAVDYRPLLFGDPGLVQAWIADVQAQAIGGTAPIPDDVIDAAIANVAKSAPFPMPPAVTEAPAADA